MLLAGCATPGSSNCGDEDEREWSSKTPFAESAPFQGGRIMDGQARWTWTIETEDELCTEQHAPYDVAVTELVGEAAERDCAYTTSTTSVSEVIVSEYASGTGARFPLEPTEHTDSDGVTRFWKRHDEFGMNQYRVPVPIAISVEVRIPARSTDLEPDLACARSLVQEVSVRIQYKQAPPADE